MSKIKEYITDKGWNFREVKDEIQIEICPIPGCAKENYHFSINSISEKWHCWVCQERGSSLRQLQYAVGDRISGLTSLIDTTSDKIILPDVDKLHKDLEDNPDAQDYLICDRGFSYKTIEELKLGVSEQFFAKLGKTAKCIAYPYFKDGKVVYVKYRTIPPEEKDFISTECNDVPLFNQDCIREDLEELYITEGEADAIALYSAGTKNVVGIPGASTSRKSTFINTLSKLEKTKFIICLDSDSPGQKGAKDLAIRLGCLDRIYNIVLPKFKTTEGKDGKDLNEFLRLSGGYEKFLELKNISSAFNIDGVQSVSEVIDEIEADFLANEGSFKPTLDTPWPTLNGLIGGAEYGDLIGIVGLAGIGKTSFSLNWLDYYARFKDLNVFMFCQEMPVKRMVRKWQTLVTGTPEDKFTKETFNLVKDIIKPMKGNLLFGRTDFDKPSEVFETMLQAKKRYGINVICFDNLHILSKNIKDKSSELDSLSKKFKQIAMELNVLILLIVQPSKVDRSEIISIYDARGSAAIVQDLDTGIALHRKSNMITQRDFSQLGVVDIQESFEPYMLIDVGKCRYSNGGKGTLEFIGETSLVKEIMAQQAPMVAMAKSYNTEI